VQESCGLFKGRCRCVIAANLEGPVYSGPFFFGGLMSTFLDYDPLRGVAQYQDSTYGDNRLQIHYKQDVEPILEVAKTERINGLTDKGIKKDLWLYARIPPVVILEMKYKHGVDVFKRDHMKKAFQLINSEYPYLKCTEKTHTVRG
jgi:hypothetical protein